MTFSDVSIVALRVLREVAERGTLSAAAAALGYTQSGVSRQIAGLERAAGVDLLVRRHDGVRLTSAGQIVMRCAATVLDQVGTTERELAGLPSQEGTVRLGWFASAGTGLLPPALGALRATHPGITVITREGSTPALVRALRARALDLVLLVSAPPFRALDAETPALSVQTLTERSLLVAVPASHPLARGEYIDVDDLAGQVWIAGPGRERVMGVWPGLEERPQIAHTARDWLAKLHLVASGCGLTTIPAMLAPSVPPGVRVLPVRGGPSEQRRVLLARLPGVLSEPVAALAAALRDAALHTESAS